VLRLIWETASGPCRLLTQHAFVQEFGALTEADWALLPAGSVLVEGFDKDERLAWRAHYKNASGLRALLQQLRTEHALAQLANPSRVGHEEH